MTVALIDGDIVCYRAAIVQQTSFKWDADTTTTSLSGSAHEAAQTALELVKAWTKLAGCKRSILAFTGTDNFRKRLLPSYKANRTTGKPLVYQETVMACEERYRCERVQGLEGDDLLGILSTNPKYVDSVIVSVDKDLRTIPGHYFNPIKDRSPRLITEPDADYFWMLQTLMGDTSDGYKGLPGCGEVKATKVLEGAGRSPEGYFRRVAAAFKAKKLTEADALVQARVARILRYEDWNKEAKTIRLWHPTKPLWTPAVEGDETRADRAELGRVNDTHDSRAADAKRKGDKTSEQ